MAKLALDGKKILIATCERTMTAYLNGALNVLGAKVLISEFMPHLSENVNAIYGEVMGKKIDAVVIHNPHIENSQNKTAVLGIVEKINNKVCVILCDFHEITEKHGPLLSLVNGYLNCQKLSEGQIAIAIASVILRRTGMDVPVELTPYF